MKPATKLVLIISMIAILLFTPIIPVSSHESEHVTALTSQCVFDWVYGNYISPIFIDVK